MTTINQEQFEEIKARFDELLGDDQLEDMAVLITMVEKLQAELAALKDRDNLKIYRLGHYIYPDDDTGEFVVILSPGSKPEDHAFDGWVVQNVFPIVDGRGLPIDRPLSEEVGR